MSAHIEVVQYAVKSSLTTVQGKVECVCVCVCVCERENERERERERERGV